MIFDKINPATDSPVTIAIFDQNNFKDAQDAKDSGALYKMPSSLGSGDYSTLADALELMQTCEDCLMGTKTELQMVKVIGNDYVLINSETLELDNYDLPEVNTKDDKTEIIRLNVERSDAFLEILNQKLEESETFGISFASCTTEKEKAEMIAMIPYMEKQANGIREAIGIINEDKESSTEVQKDIIVNRGRELAYLFSPPEIHGLTMGLSVLNEKEPRSFKLTHHSANLSL